MDQIWCCPNCLKRLSKGKETAQCNWCGANFEAGAVWSPIKKSEIILSEDDSTLNFIGRFVGRLFLGGLIWGFLLVLVFLSAIPYGGGDRKLISLLQIFTVILPIWAVWPLLMFLRRSISKD